MLAVHCPFLLLPGSPALDSLRRSWTILLPRSTLVPDPAASRFMIMGCIFPLRDELLWTLAAKLRPNRHPIGHPYINELGIQRNYRRTVDANLNRCSLARRRLPKKELELEMHAFSVALVKRSVSEIARVRDVQTAGWCVLLCNPRLEGHSSIGSSCVRTMRTKLVRRPCR